MNEIETVADLVKRLLNFDQSLPVCVYDLEGSFTRELHDVELSKVGNVLVVIS